MSENSLAGAWRRPPDAVVRLARAVRTRQVPLLMAAAVACGAAILVGRLNQGWWQHDDGSLAHSAQRALSGELPHRDFADLYTGLLSFLNAGVFAVLGEDMFNMRIPLFVLFLAFIPCYFAIARRLVTPIWAFVATLTAVTWSVPVYPAPMPSWYLLFLTTFGTYAVVRFFETRRSKWLLLAGLCGGIGIAIKIVGVWFAVAVALGLLAEPLLRDVTDSRTGRRRGAVVLAAAALAWGLVFLVVARQLTGGNVAGLWAPVTIVCGGVGLVGYRALREPSLGTGVGPTREVAIFITGVIAPLAIFATPYVLTGSIGELLNGVLVAPQTRLEFASRAMPPVTSLLWAAPLVTLLLARPRLPKRHEVLVDVGASAILAFFVLTAGEDWSYTALWNPIRAIAPFAVVLGAYALVKRDLKYPPGRALVGLIALVAGLSLLLQFPFAAPVYFCYIAPLVLLAGIASSRATGLANGIFPGVALIALAVFGFRQLDQQSVASLGVNFKADPQVAVLDDHRASIRVQPEVARDYARIVELVAGHRGSSDIIFAGPDAPAVYFLTESRNATPVILDFLDGRTTTGERLIRLLKEDHIKVIVLNHKPEQSPAIDAAVVSQIRSHYGGSERVGQFEVRWVDNVSR